MALCLDSADYLLPIFFVLQLTASISFFIPNMLNIYVLTINKLRYLPDWVLWAAAMGTENVELAGRL